LRRPEPGLLLVAATLVRLVAGLGQAHSAHPQSPRFLFIAECPLAWLCRDK
jgi:hypothetical protein